MTDNDTLRERIAGELSAARDRTTYLTTAVDEADLVRQHSPLMSPLVWDLAHVANQEELWLLREVGGADPDPPRDRPAVRRVRAPAVEAADAAAARAGRGARLRPRGPRPGLDLLEKTRFERHENSPTAGSRSA